MVPCGDVSVFCPEGSAAGTAVDVGYYTVGSSDDVNLRTGERICEPGSYCAGGVKYDCPAGSYGTEFGETNSACNGLCEEGYMCTAGSTSKKQLPCGDPDRYCPPGTITPSVVKSGYYSTGGTEVTRTGESLTEVGHYSVKGVKRKCPAGRYGGEVGLSSSSCSGECMQGYYCEPGSTHRSQKFCGNPGVFCPTSSIGPTRVWDGYYTTTEGVDECGPGTFMNMTNVVDVTISPTQVGSVIKTKVPRGSCDLCPAGKYKAGDGDDKSLCLKCPLWSTNAAGHKPLVVGNSTKDRTSCECYRADGGEAFDELYFNITSEKCVAVPKGSSIPDTQKSGVSRRTRFEQFEVS
jgi:hypothetical protein